MLFLWLVMPWEQTDEYIRSGHRNPEDFKLNSFRTIWINQKEGIKAVIGKPKNKHQMEIVSYLFMKSKGWTLEKAKQWFKKHKKPRSNSETLNHYCYVAPIIEKILEKPLRIKGIAITAGISRNLNIYIDKELEEFAKKLVGAPVYLEHVSAFGAIGKVTNAEWNPNTKTVFYEAEIYDDEIAEKIRKGLIQHVSIAADYEKINVVNGKIPRGLHNAELSLVAVPGVPTTSIEVIENLRGKCNASSLSRIEESLLEIRQKLETLTASLETLTNSNRERWLNEKYASMRAVIAPEAVEQTNHTVDFSTVRLRDVMEKII
jgi:hypothetical protein